MTKAVYMFALAGFGSKEHGSHTLAFTDCDEIFNSIMKCLIVDKVDE